VVDGTVSILILKDGGNLIAARDKVGRLPVLIGKDEDGYAVTFESFAYQKLGYEDERELGPGEIVEISPDGIEQLVPPSKKMKICAFLWSYYGYPTATYEGVNVEAMRYRNGMIMAKSDMETGICKGIDYVSGVPDSGTPHAIGYSNASGIHFSRSQQSEL
jgi:amidophosphoribosyltransferase